MSGDIYEDGSGKQTKLGKHLDMCRQFLEVCFKNAPKNETEALCMLTSISATLAVELSDLKIRKAIGQVISPASKDFKPVNPMPKQTRKRKAKKKVVKSA